MARKYTAQEMRSKADEFKEYLDNPNHFAVKEFDDESRVLMEMLRQAAVLQEREEMRERKYEYAILWDYDDSLFEASIFHEYIKRRMDEMNADGPVCHLVRREVGEWEEVQNED